MPDILTYDNTTYVENFSRKSNIIDEYKANMFSYIRHLHPNLSDQEIKSKIDQICRDRFKETKLKYIKADSPCKIEVKEDGLLAVTNAMNTDILSPYGAAYCQSTVAKGVFSEYIEGNQNERKRVKKEMFLADCRGDKQGVFINDLRQKNVKIKINALSGVMLSNVTFRSSINYNAITATSRFIIMMTYAVTELSLGSNYYFFSENKAINWIVNLLRVYPGDPRLERCFTKYNLTTPSSDRVFFEYDQQIKKYHPMSKNDELKELIESLSDKKRAFVYYGMNMYRIFFDNEHFKGYFKELITVENAPIIEGEIPNITKLSDDLISTLVVTILAPSIGKKSLVDIEAGDKDLARKIYSVYVYIENKLSYLENLFETLIILPLMPADINLHKNMLRNTVLLSDTDSILFTTVNWMKWFTGDIRITEEASRFNSVIVTLISKLLDHSYCYASASMNMGINDIRTLRVKNEFMYDVFLRTCISKHYAGYVRFKEGVFQDPYKFDLKGKNFKGSDLCKETTTYVKWFIKYIFDTFLETYELHPGDLISKAISFEQRIIESIKDGKVTFLMQKPINLRDQYAKPESSNYLYYGLWQDIFAEKYGDLNLPQKTKELPIYSVNINFIEPLHHMKEINGEIYNKFIEYLKKYPKKTFSRVLIPMDIEIPEELRAIADYRKVCAANCYSMELILRSFNITCYPNKKSKVLFSDMYPHILKELENDSGRISTEITEEITEEDDFYEEDEFDEDDESESDESDEF